MEYRRGRLTGQPVHVWADVALTECKHVGDEEDDIDQWFW